MDNAGNIVEKFQPCSITVENGVMMKNTGARSYVTAPAGTYELGVLFRKKGETTWIKADRKDNVTKQDMIFTVKEQTNLPALRMIQVEDEINTGVVNHYCPYNTNFNITYILSNRGSCPKGRNKKQFGNVHLIIPDIAIVLVPNGRIQRTIIPGRMK